jgi:hypothetical protein
MRKRIDQEVINWYFDAQSRVEKAVFRAGINVMAASMGQRRSRCSWVRQGPALAFVVGHLADFVPFGGWLTIFLDMVPMV